MTSRSATGHDLPVPRTSRLLSTAPPESLFVLSALFLIVGLFLRSSSGMMRLRLIVMSILAIALLSLVFGRFHVGMIVVTWVAFQQINLHNHDLWDRDRFAGGYIATMAEMHHHHHARFTGGNFATITLLYDWMFGTLDYGKGPGVKVSREERFAKKSQAAVASEA